MEDAEARILELVRGAAAWRQRRVTLSSTLCRDLGIRGEDAAELVEAVVAAFGVDASRLYTHWDRHFPPENPDDLPLTGIFAALACIPVFIATDQWVGRVGAWIAGALVVGGAFWLSGKLWNRYLGRRADWYIEVSVQDLVNMVRAGRWEREYDY